MQQHQQASWHPSPAGTEKWWVQTIITQPLTWLLRNSLTKITLQRPEVLLHQHDQEHGQPLALLRGLIQASTPSSKMEVSNQQGEIVELREAKLWYLCHEELNYQLCATVQWTSSWQQQQVVQNACTINIFSCRCSAGDTIWWCGSVWLGSSVLAMTKCLLHGKWCYWWSHVTAASLSILSTPKRSIKACWKDLYARCMCMHVWFVLWCAACGGCHMPELCKSVNYIIVNNLSIDSSFLSINSSFLPLYST